MLLTETLNHRGKVVEKCRWGIRSHAYHQLSNWTLNLPPDKEGSGLPGGAVVKESACQCRRGKRLVFNPWVGKIPWRRKWQPTPAFLPGESHERRSLVGCSPWGREESDTTEPLST